MLSSKGSYETSPFDLTVTGSFPLPISLFPDLFDFVVVLFVFQDTPSSKTFANKVRFEKSLPLFSFVPTLNDLDRT